jgi:hypothetical protein
MTTGPETVPMRRLHAAIRSRGRAADRQPDPPIHQPAPRIRNRQASWNSLARIPPRFCRDRMSAEPLIRRQSAAERLRFWVRWKTKAAITQIIIWLSALWDRI